MEPETKINLDTLERSINQGATGPSPERPLSPWVGKYRWRFEVYHYGLQPVLPAIHRFCSDVLNHRTQPDVVPYWLTILGPSGVGKTLALHQAFKMLANNDHLWEVDTRTGTRLPQCAHLIPGRDLKDYKAPEDYADYDLLYVEDIGAGSTSEKGSGAVTTSRVAELLQYRTGKWTLMCANLSIAEVAQRVDPRIASRLKRDGSVLLELPMDIPDFNFRPQ